RHGWSVSAGLDCKWSLRLNASGPSDLRRGIFRERPLPLAVGPLGGRRRLDPTRQRTRDLAQESLPSFDQAAEQTGLAPVALIEGDPREGPAIGPSGTLELQGDLPLRPVDHRLRNPCGATPGAVAAPGLGQEEFVVEQAVERPIGQGQMDGDDAVVVLAGGPAL